MLCRKLAMNFFRVFLHFMTGNENDGAEQWGPLGGVVHRFSICDVLLHRAFADSVEGRLHLFASFYRQHAKFRFTIAPSCASLCCLIIECIPKLRWRLFWFFWSDFGESFVAVNFLQKALCRWAQMGNWMCNFVQDISLSTSVIRFLVFGFAVEYETILSPF